jgi:uncharacterized protein (DUF2384 family)
VQVDERIDGVARELFVPAERLPEIVASLERRPLVEPALPARSALKRIVDVERSPHHERERAVGVPVAGHARLREHEPADEEEEHHEDDRGDDRDERGQPR